MASILIAYSTVDGHTLEICKRLAQALSGHGHAVTLMSIDVNPDMDLAPYDRIVIGASIRYGRHRGNVKALIDRNRAILGSKPGAFLSVSLVARKAARNQVDTNPYVKRFLRTIVWQPQAVAVIAGKLDYPKYRFWDRLVIRLIMWMTNGPTNPDAVVDYTDWQQVDAFAATVSAMDRAVGKA